MPSESSLRLAVDAALNSLADQLHEIAGSLYFDAVESVALRRNGLPETGPEQDQHLRRCAVTTALLLRVPWEEADAHAGHELIDRSLALVDAEITALRQLCRTHSAAADSITREHPNEAVDDERLVDSLIVILWAHEH